VSYTIDFDVPLDAIPPNMSSRIRKELEEIGAVLDDIPADSIIWDSLGASALQLDVGPWRITYVVDTAKQRIVVNHFRLRS
jgi:hypothetical protein